MSSPDLRGPSSQAELIAAIGSNTVAAVERRLSPAELMTATAVSWDGATGVAVVHPDNTPDGETPPEIHAMSQIGIIQYGERVWIRFENHGCYVVGRGTRTTWQPVQDGGWFPLGNTGTNPTLGSGGTANAGFHVRDGITTMTFTISLGTGASNSPGGVSVGRWQFPLPIPVVPNPGWDLPGRTMAFGSCFVYDGHQYVGICSSVPGQTFFEIRIHGAAASLGRDCWPPSNGVVDAPAAGTLICGTANYPSSE